MASMTRERKNLPKEIKEINKNIRQKHYALTQDFINLEEQTEKSPIIYIIGNVEMDNIQERLKIKRALEEDPSTRENKFPVKRPAIEVENDEPAMQTSSYEETVYKTPPRVEEYASTPEGRQEAKYYIDNLFQGVLVKRYMHMFLDDRNHKIDHVVGSYYRDGDI